MYLGSREFASRPFVDALNESGIPAELVVLSGGKIARLKKTLRSAAPIVIVDAPYLPSTALALMKRMGAFKGEYIIRLRGDVFTEMKSFKTPFLRRATDMSINSALSVLPVAKYLEDRLRETHPDASIHTIYNGVDTDLFSPKFSEKEKPSEIVIVTVMNFSIPRKLARMDQLPPIIDQLSKEYDVRFLVAGGGKHLNQIKASFYKSDSVTFLGQLPRSGIVELLSSADIFLYPTSLDILPNAVLEASAMELPVVSTDVGGIPEIVADSETGFLVKDVQECKSKLQMLIEDEKLRCELGKSGRKRMLEKFSWSKTTERFVEYIKTIRGET
ncbi:MAG: glycosyltransferase family 4 protein [Candidatus Hydrothermarchaeaceae archaeon]